MRTFLFFLSAFFFILAIASFCRKYINKEIRKIEILRKIRIGEKVPYNKDVEEMIEAGLLDENLKPKF